MFKSAVSFINRLIESTNQQGSRRKVAHSRYNIQHCDILEARTLLTGPEAPGFKQLLTNLGDVLMEPYTSHNNGVLSVSLDVNGDGDVELQSLTISDKTLFVSLSEWIEPNSSAPVTIKLSESYDANEPDLTHTVVLNVPGIDVDPVPFVWIAAADGIVAGKADTSQALGTVSLIYREVGQTEWTTLLEIWNNFDSRFPAADGVKDFEFSTIHQIATVSVYGPITTINNITQNAIVNPPADPAGGGGTTTGGTTTGGSTTGGSTTGGSTTGGSTTGGSTTGGSTTADDEPVATSENSDTDDEDMTETANEVEYEAIDDAMIDYGTYAYTETEDTEEADSLIDVLVELT